MLTACSRVSLSLVLSLSAAGSRGTPRLDSSPPERQPARLLGNGNPGAGELRSRQPGELQGRPRRRWACGAEPGVGAPVPTPAGNAAWQGTLPGRTRGLPCFWKPPRPRSPREPSDSPSAALLRGRLRLGLAPALSLAVSSVSELSSLPPPEPVQGDR